MIFGVRHRHRQGHIGTVIRGPGRNRVGPSSRLIHFRWWPGQGVALGWRWLGGWRSLERMATTLVSLLKRLGGGSVVKARVRNMGTLALARTELEVLAC